jgi:HEPN domain
VAALTLAAVAPTFFLIVSGGRRDTPNWPRPRRAGHLLGREPGSDGDRNLAAIGHPADTETSPVTAHYTARIAPLSPALPSCGRNGGGPRFGISLEICHDRIYEPYGRTWPFPGGIDFPHPTRSKGELSAAGKTLEALGLADIRVETSGYVSMKITGEGLRVATDACGLARALPLTAADDAEIGSEIVSDALRPLILDCEQLLRERGWTEASAELDEGDRAFADERWRDAVREYYRAVESGLKYRLTEAGVTYGGTTALRPLASLGVQGGLIPRNYQELFSFLNSIRSPKSHGGGPTPQDVPIGRNEALLMGNHARALLLYLGGTAA